MMIRSLRFNIYLLLALVCTLAAGCKTNPSAKVMATLRAHIETSPNSTGQNSVVPIYRANPVSLTIERVPILSEENVAEARVIEVMGGFAIQIQFDRKGTWVLQQASGGSRGRRLAIFSQFTSVENAKGSRARWLGAPVLSSFIDNGILVFTPDATREEAYQIVLGLNNVAKKYQSE